MEVFADKNNEYQEMVNLGNHLLGEKDYENAIRAFGEAMQLQVKKYGDLDQNCAQIYFLYGKAMVDNYRENSGIFSEKVGSAYPEVPFHLKTDDNPSGKSSDSEESNDLEIAWENLDAARLILETSDDEFSKNLLADVHICLGLIEFESGREENACAEIKTAILLLEDFKTIDCQHYAHAAYELALIYSLRSVFDQALKYFELSRNILADYVAKLKEDLSLNREKIERLSHVIEELDDKVQDCTACLNEPRVEEKEPTPMPVSQSNSDVTHLVKRKVFLGLAQRLKKTGM